MSIAFERIAIVMLENATRANVLANPYMNALRTKGVFLSGSMGVTHPSQPNYVLSIGGDTFGICNDEPGYVQWIDNPQSSVPISNIVDLLDAQNLTWRCYAQDLPAGYTTETAQGYPGTIPPDEGYFARKHVPFLSYPNIVTNPERLANIVNATEFEQDLANGKLPNYSWYTPNLIDDGHSLTPKQLAGHPDDRNRLKIENIAAFLSAFLGDDPVSKFPPETPIVITFDEVLPYEEPYGIYTLLIGDMLQAGTTVTIPYNHYSMLRSIEVNFGLGNLGRNDVTAIPWWFLADRAPFGGAN
ncbi:MAG: hypothetical protein F6J93_26340 [Oscillatoria sp. SIO1A7]|nr:hypothetical protein [Oscillatoria sp. SIO1A7]